MHAACVITDAKIHAAHRACVPGWMLHAGLRTPCCMWDHAHPDARCMQGCTRQEARCTWDHTHQHACRMQDLHTQTHAARRAAHAKRHAARRITHADMHAARRPCTPRQRLHTGLHAQRCRLHVCIWVCVIPAAACAHCAHQQARSTRNCARGARCAQD